MPSCGTFLNSGDGYYHVVIDTDANQETTGCDYVLFLNNDYNNMISVIDSYEARISVLESGTTVADPSASLTDLDPESVLYVFSWGFTTVLMFWAIGFAVKSARSVIMRA